MNPESYCDTPWGRWEVLLEAPYCKVKRIIVNQNQRLSYQKHFKREEIWTIVQGTATITLDGVTQDYQTGQIVNVPTQTCHRVANKYPETLVLIEIQQGSYFGEDDIVRLEDDYGRE